MISNNNGILTENEIAAYNAAIENFIKCNSNYVDMSERDDGYTYITLRYGPVRDATLKEIATRCKNSLIDDVFKIGVLACSITYANGSILRFKGKTSEILEGMKQLDSSSYGGLIDKSKVNVELPENFAQTVATIVKKYTTGRKDFTDATKKNEGLNFYQSGSKDHFGIDVNVLSKHVSTTSSPREDAIELNKVCQTIVKLYQENSKLITETLATNLAKLYIYLERVNSNIVLFAYDIISETTSGNGNSTSNPVDEFEYTKVPGKLTKMIVHFGDVTKDEVSKTDFNSTQMEFNEGYPCEVLTDTDNVVIGVGTEYDLTNLMTYYKKVSTPSKVLLSLPEFDPDNTSISTLLSTSIIENNNNESLIAFIKNEILHKGSILNIEDITSDNMYEYVNEHAHIGTNEGVVLLDTYYGNSAGIGELSNSVLGVTPDTVSSIYNASSGLSNYDSWSTIDFHGNILVAAVNSGRAIDIYLV